MPVLRITKYCPIEGSSLTTIYIRRCFRWKIKHKYRMLLTELRTIGTREPNLGLPSITREFGSIIGYKYIYKQENVKNTNRIDFLISAIIIILVLGFALIMC